MQEPDGVTGRGSPLTGPPVHQLFVRYSVIRCRVSRLGRVGSMIFIGT